MRVIRALIVFFYCLWYPFLVALAYLIPCPCARCKALAWCRRTWANSVLRILKINVKILAPDKSSGAGLYVANHRSYLDILILTASTGGVFISRNFFWWPLLGQMAYLGGTIFIDRSARMSVADIIPKMRRRLDKGVNVVFFPEGTTNNGEELLPFKTPFFSAAKFEGSETVYPIRPVTIKYATIGGGKVDRTNRDRIFWYGDMDFASHIWGVTSAPGIEVELRFLPEQEPLDDRKAFAGKIREEMLKDMENRGAFV